MSDSHLSLIHICQDGRVQDLCAVPTDKSHLNSNRQISMRNRRWSERSELELSMQLSLVSKIE